MLGTVVLIALVAMGYLNTSSWIIIPAAFAMAWIGLRGKEHRLEGRNSYWAVFFQSLPLQAILAALFYGLGYGARVLVDTI